MDEGAAAKFACVKAMGTLNADANDLYKLFLDNERVHVSSRARDGKRSIAGGGAIRFFLDFGLRNTEQVGCRAYGEKICQ